MLILTAALLVVCACAAGAAELQGVVVGVQDGDTITVIDSENHRYRVRLAGIDAPERQQPYGSRSKEHLAKTSYGQRVTVRWSKHDRYGRIVGVVLVAGEDIGLEQLRAGLAWWYRQYAHEQTEHDRALYERAEYAARSEKLGLWIDPDPQPPWLWRRR